MLRPQRSADPTFEVAGGARRVDGGRLAAAVLLILAMLGTLFTAAPGSTPLAHADGSCMGTVSDFSWVSGSNITEDGTTYRSRGGQLARVTFSWSVPAEASAGDTFTVTLPQALEIHPLLSPFSVYEGSDEVAKVTWSSGAGSVMTFTLTDYVNTHSNVSGTATVTVVWTDGTSPGDYDLTFTGCQGSGTLKGTLLPEPTSGVFSSSSKYGVVDPDSSTVVWNLGIGSATKGDYSDSPLVVEDPGGDGYTLSCDNLMIDNITPAPYTEVVYYRNFLPKSCYTCEVLGDRGVRVTFNKNSNGNYIDKYETYMLDFTATLDSNYKDYDKLYNTATVRNGPVADVDTINGDAEVPDAGGSGKQVHFSIEKRTEGPAPADSTYTFEYKCRGDSFTELAAIQAGQTTTSAATKSSASCTIQEKNIPSGVHVSYALADTSSGANLVDNGDGSLTLSFAADSEANVTVVATNTYPAERATFAVSKESWDRDVTIEGDTTRIERTYTVKVTNTGNAAGVSPQVLDTPGVPEGFTISEVTVDGSTVNSDTGTYVVTRGDILNADSQLEHEGSWSSTPWCPMTSARRAWRGSRSAGRVPPQTRPWACTSP